MNDEYKNIRSDAADELFDLLLQEQGITVSQSTTIKPRADKTNFPLSFGQERLWFLYQLERDSPFYNMHSSVRLTGDLDIDVLMRCLNTLVQRHKVLQANFITIDGLPRQTITTTRPVSLPVIELQGLEPEEQERSVQEWSKREARCPFDLERSPLLQFKLLKLGVQQHVILLTMHHIISDGWSLGVFIREMAALYEAFVAGKASPLKELPIQYADYAIWQRERLQGDLAEQQLTYWRNQLTGAPPTLELPTDRPRPAVQRFKGARYSFNLSASLTAALQALSQQEGATLFMVLLTGFNLLLQRYTRQSDIVIGTPIAGRTQAETDGLIGFLVNTLVLRVDGSGNPTVRELLQRVKAVTLDAYAHQELPFEKLVEGLQPIRSLSYQPLFQVVLTLNNAPGSALTIPGLILEQLDVDSGISHFDITLFAFETHQGLSVTAEYDTDLFDRSTIVRMMDHFQHALAAMVADPTQYLSHLPLLAFAERQEVLEGWQGEEREYAWAREKSLEELFEGQVNRSPDAIAVVFEEQRLSYRELNERANQLGHYLRHQGVGPDVLVGICMERSVEMMVGLLGILKAGGAYLPLDADYPQERLAFMLEDARPAVVLTQERLLARIPRGENKMICLDRDWATIADESTKTPEHYTRMNNLAYVIYTSGSTGKPKGAMNTHGGICNRLAWMQETYQLTERDRVLQKTPFSFDVSVWEFFWPVITGARLVMARPEGHVDPAYLVRTIIEQGITTLHFVPAMLHAFLDQSGLEACVSLKRVICSGEALSVNLQTRFFSKLGAELHNLYGPTEAAVDVTFWRCQQESQLNFIPIGRPIANIQIYILDGQQQPVPIGVPGELYIGGIGVARGYLNRAELTAEKFIPNPFSAEPGARLYRTGDLSRHLPDGNIEYLGRIDNQIKLRGFRIELGEIEAALEQHPGVEASVVLAQDDEKSTEQNGLRLVAYVVPVPSYAPSLQGHKRYRLPNKMAIVHLNKNETDYTYQEIFEQQIYLKHGITLREGDCVFDVGANIGLFTLFAHQVCRDPKVYAFEPNPGVNELLRANTTLYAAGAKTFDYGLANENKTAQFTAYSGFSLLSGFYADADADKQVVKQFMENQRASGLDEMDMLIEYADELLENRFAPSTFTVSLKTISTVIREQAIERIDLLKIDVEKSELDVLHGIDEADWDKIAQIVIELDGEEHRNRIERLLQNHGFEVSIQQDALLDNTQLYYLYAIHPSRVQQGAPRHQVGENLLPIPQFDDQFLTPNDLRSFLKTKLPEYMIPAVFVILEQLPLTPNNKVDRNALRDPAPLRLDLKESFIPPRTDSEIQLVEIWTDLLMLDRVGIHDNFFELGGHSLLTIQMKARIHQVFQIELPLRSLFQFPTVAELAALLEQSHAHRDKLPTITKRISRENAQELIEKIDQLSKQEIDLLLDNLLSSGENIE